LAPSLCPQPRLRTQLPHQTYIFMGFGGIVRHKMVCNPMSITARRQKIIIDRQWPHIGYMVGGGVKEIRTEPVDAQMPEAAGWLEMNDQWQQRHCFLIGCDLVVGESANHIPDQPDAQDSRNPQQHQVLASLHTLSHEFQKPR